MELNLYLIVDVDKRTGRVVARKPRPSFGKFVYDLSINVPDAWFAPLGQITISVPEPPDEEMLRVAETFGLRGGNDKEEVDR